MNRHIIVSLIAAAALSLAGPSLAGGGHGHSHGGHGQQANQTERSAQGIGEIRSVAEGGGSVVLAHEPIAELRWPAMTMELALADPGLAEGLEAGTRVHFVLRQTGETDYEIVSIEPADGGGH